MGEFETYSTLIEQEFNRRGVSTRRLSRRAFVTETGLRFVGTAAIPQQLTRIVRDKAATKTLLAGANLYTPDWLLVPNGELPEANPFEYYPVITKPNQGSLAVGITLAHDFKQLIAGVKLAQKGGDDCLIEAYIPGTKWRIFASSRRHLSNIRYLPLTVTGNGSLSLASLVRRRDMERRYASRFKGQAEPPAKTRPDWEWLAKHSYYPDSIVARGEEVRLSPVEARASGAISEELGPIVGFDVASRAIQAIPGLFTSALDIIEFSGRFYILELNGHPYFRQHLSPELGTPVPFIRDFVQEYMEVTFDDGIRTAVGSSIPVND